MPKIVTATLSFELSVMPLGSDNLTVNVRGPLKGVPSLMGTLHTWGVELPLAQCSVVLTAVKSRPAIAVPLAVWHSTLTAPLVLPLRYTVTLSVPLFCTREALVWAT